MANFFTTFKVTVHDRTTSGCRYLTKEHIRPIAMLADELHKCSCEEAMVAIARRIVNADKRNQKAQSHERIMADIRDFITQEVESGESFTTHRLACYLLEQWNFNKLPIYAVRAICERMVKEGVLKVSYEIVTTPEEEYNRRARKVYTRI